MIQNGCNLLSMIIFCFVCLCNYLLHHACLLQTSTASFLLITFDTLRALCNSYLALFNKTSKYIMLLIFLLEFMDFFFKYRPCHKCSGQNFTANKTVKESVRYLQSFIVHLVISYIVALVIESVLGRCMLSSSGWDQRARYRLLIFLIDSKGFR